MGPLQEYNRRYNISAWDWISFFAAIFCFWAGFQGEDGYNFWVSFILFGLFWIVTAPFRAVSWVNRRLNSRPCPVCGIRVSNGETQCAACGTDFRVR